MHPKSMHPIMSICPMLSSDTCINYDNCSKKLKSLFAVMFLKEAEGRALEGGGGQALKPKQQTVSNEVNTKMQISTQCRACGTIKTFQNTLISF